MDNRWSRDEFVAYLLIHAAETDSIMSAEEVELLENRFGAALVKKMKKEVDAANDFQRLEKMMAYKEEAGLSAADADSIMWEVKEVFEADGVFDSAEEAVFLFLKKLFA